MAFMLVVEDSIHFLSGTNWLVVNRNKKIKREAAKGQGENEEKLTKKLPFWYWNLWIFFSSLKYECTLDKLKWLLNRNYPDKSYMLM